MEHTGGTLGDVVGSILLHLAPFIFGAAEDVWLPLKMADRPYR